MRELANMRGCSSTCCLCDFAQIPVSYDDPAAVVKTLRQLIDAGFTHLVLMPATPCPEGVARRVADNLIRPLVSR
jgi:hypothetical protein